MQTWVWFVIILLVHGVGTLISASAGPASQPALATTPFPVYPPAGPSPSPQQEGRSDRLEKRAATTLPMGHPVQTGGRAGAAHCCGPLKPRSRRRRQAGNQVLDRFLQARNPLPGQELHAGRALELRQFLLEREQALASSSEVDSLLARWRT